MITLTIEITGDCDLDGTELDLLKCLLDAGAESTNLSYEIKIEDLNED